MLNIMFHIRSCRMWSLSKVIAEKLLVTFHELKWLWWHGEGSLVAIFRLRASTVKSTCNPMLERVSNDFRPKETPFVFPHWLIMERSRNWPDLRSPISKFGDKHFIDTVTDINRWQFQGDRSFGVAMMSIQTFFLRWGNLAWPGDLTLSDLGLKFSQHVRKICMNRFAKNGGAVENL